MIVRITVLKDEGLPCPFDPNQKGLADLRAYLEGAMLAGYVYYGVEIDPSQLFPSDTYMYVYLRSGCSKGHPLDWRTPGYQYTMYWNHLRDV